jgi:putative flippase GtrA
MKGNAVMDKLKRLLNRETILYLVFGVATTLVNYIVFYLCYEVLYGRDNSLIANAVAFVAAVIFAFVVNKTFVFESKHWTMDVLRKEVPPFLAARVGSFLVEEAGLFLCEEVMQLGNVVMLIVGEVELTGVTIAKIGLSFIVVVLNYVFCKFFVFKK